MAADLFESDDAGATPPDATAAIPLPNGSPATLGDVVGQSI